MKQPDKPILCYVTDRKSLGTPLGADAILALIEKIRAAVGAGADWIQIREKDLPGAPLLALTREAIRVAGCGTPAGEAKGDSGAPGEGSGVAASEARVYVNDRLDVALAASAAGVHLGGESLPPGDVVRSCRAGNAPAGFRVGVSCHSIENAREAESGGADYIFFGPIFDTPAKRGWGPPQGLARLRAVCRAVRLPVIAIGGVNEANAAECIGAGASGIAAIRLFQEAADSRALEKLLSSLHRSKEGKGSDRS